MSLFTTSEGRRAARLLEWPQLLESVAGQASLGRAADHLRALEPVADGEVVTEVWRRVEELHRFLAGGDELPLASMLDLEDALGEEARRRGPLEPEALAAVGAAAVALADLRSALDTKAERLPLAAEAWRDAPEVRPVGDHLLAALEPDGRIRDRASPALGGLRRALARARSKVRETAQREMQRALADGHTTGESLVQRDGRFCIPLRSGRRRQVAGVVHDRSSTGHTVFVEPLPVVEASSELQEAHLAVVEEERRIVMALNEHLRPHADSLLDLFARAVDLDTLRARARWGLAHGGRIPTIAPPREPRLSLPGFRHPLLTASLEEAGRAEDVVPLDLELSAEDRLLLVSGPNAGGKTVALKAVGLAQLMAQAGIPLPCDPAAEPPELGLCDRVLMEVGDEQSIADALSSFSAHVTHLRDILQQATPASLVLLDEPGGGTDPLEGVALARALLEHLAERRIRTLATTHYGELKALGRDLPGLRNASMLYDQEELRPRFRLVLDVPGSSHALEIAQRLGLDDAVLERARELMGQEVVDLASILAEMERERDRLRQAREEAEELREVARASQRQYDAKRADLRTRRRELLAEAEREAEGIVRNARARIERTLADLRRTGDADRAKERAAEARQDIDAAAQHLRERREQRQKPRREFSPQVGEPARHRGLGRVGTVVELRGGRVTLEVAGRRLVASPEELDHPGGEAAPEPQVEGTVRSEVSAPSGGASPRVDVRGQDAQDAWSAVDQALDRCVVAGLSTLEVIHGKGTGTLRRTLHDRMRDDPRVQGLKLGGGGRSDDGMTLVQL